MDMARLVAAQEGDKGRRVLGLAKAPDALGLHPLGTNLVDAAVLVTRPRFQKLLQPLGLGLAGIDPVHIHVILKTLTGQRLAEIRQRRIDRAANHEFGVRRARRAADNHHDSAMRGDKRWPEQARKSDPGVEFQGKAVDEISIILVREYAAPGGAGAVNKDIAATKCLVVRLERREAAVKRAKIGGMRHDPAVRLRGDGFCRRLAMRRIAAGNHDIRAVPRQPRGNGKPDTPRSPRHKGRLSGQ